MMQLGLKSASNCWVLLQMGAGSKFIVVTFCNVWDLPTFVLRIDADFSCVLL